MAKNTKKTAFTSKLDKIVSEVEVANVDRYELMVILKPLLPEDIKDKTVESIHTLITNQEGKVVSEDTWGKKHMAYKIKGHDEGYYLVCRVELPTAALAAVDRGLTLMTDVLRHMFIKESEL